ncbi:hypothetical protein K505DRAFT_322054 [Melanomma pulvis-pyrius CBS 109.77]|uniref:Uncharacterized protein n=1 Tax=Melanomma pulvis-pyrius CBS 109.77 TaxID=1314802 RepID=A0A6A6XPV2_9PLEO|nr:hypothetical protein K505DRAFT_322054 [Melanomma pulvis-pyrius CBS 109.77]
MALAPIELLPAELLQPIFFLSDMNIALPHSSHHIAAKLAHDYCYRAICTKYLTTNLNTRVKQSTTQTKIFASKWMTWEFFKSFVTKAWEDKGCLCGKTKYEGCYDKQWPPNFEDATTMLFTRSHLPVLSFVKCRIPVKLLHGPWTPEKTQFLRFLLWTTAMTVDWADHETRKLTLEAKKEAVLTGNLEVVGLFNHNRRLGRAPNLSMVRFAVLEGDCNRSIVYDTMAAARTWSLRGNGWNDEGLDKWCEERIKNRDPKGDWLKVKLQELRATKLSNGGHVMPGQMQPKTGDYDDVDGDKLVIAPLKWNQVSISKYRTWNW